MAYTCTVSAVEKVDMEEHIHHKYKLCLRKHSEELSVARAWLDGELETFLNAYPDISFMT